MGVGTVANASLIGLFVAGLEHVGFPWADVEDDGSATIGKHDLTGGLVSVGTVTAQLLYEIGRPEYANPDVTARFDTLHLQQFDRDRVPLDADHGAGRQAGVRLRGEQRLHVPEPR